MVLEWREHGGPPIVAPATSGFGTRLLSGLSGELGAPAEVTYHATGVTCRLRIPIA